MVESKVSKQTSRLIAESGKSCMLSLRMPAQGLESPAGADWQAAFEWPKAGKWSWLLQGASSCSAS